MPKSANERKQKQRAEQKKSGRVRYEYSPGIYAELKGKIDKSIDRLMKKFIASSTHTYNDST